MKMERYKINTQKSLAFLYTNNEKQKPRISRRKEILKIRAEINANETKETIAKINKAKSWSFEKIDKIDNH